MKQVVDFISTERIFGHIEALCEAPHRRTGSAESAQALDYIREQFTRIGLSGISIEEADSALYEIGSYDLQVNGVDISCFPINGTMHPEEFGAFETGESCRNTELIYLHEGRKEDFEGIDVAGKIVLCDCPWFEMDEDEYAENWCSKEAFVYDPDGAGRERLRKTDSYSPNAWPYNYIMAQKSGAAGFVGILNDYFRDGISWNEDYSEIALAEGCEAFAIPGLWIGTDAADKLLSLPDPDVKTGELLSGTADLQLQLRYKKGKARNIIGYLPGESEDLIIVHSHYDAVFTGAVQDASGISEMLALAEYFAGLPQDQRRYTLCFAALDGHYTDYAGHQLFVKNRLAEGRKILCDMVIEHIGKEVGLGENNEPVIREEPEIRLLYVTDVNGNVDIVKHAVVRNDLRRTIVMPVEPKTPNNDLYVFSQDEVISDGYYSDLNGIPVISILSPQMYLFHPMDTPDMIPKEELVPVGRMYAEMIMELFEIGLVQKSISG